MLQPNDLDRSAHQLSAALLLRAQRGRVVEVNGEPVPGDPATLNLLCAPFLACPQTRETLVEYLSDAEDCAIVRLVVLIEQLLTWAHDDGRLTWPQGDTSGLTGQAPRIKHTMQLYLANPHVRQNVLQRLARGEHITLGQPAAVR
jgi:hypothetical protein